MARIATGSRTFESVCPYTFNIIKLKDDVDESQFNFETMEQSRSKDGQISSDDDGTMMVEQINTVDEIPELEPEMQSAVISELTNGELLFTPQSPKYTPIGDGDIWDRNYANDIRKGAYHDGSRFRARALF